jgi:hypothetical protein
MRKDTFERLMLVVAGLAMGIEGTLIFQKYLLHLI